MIPNAVLDIQLAAVDAFRLLAALVPLAVVAVLPFLPAPRLGEAVVRGIRRTARPVPERAPRARGGVRRAA